MGIQNADLENVLCNSFGFGGNDSSLLISLHPKESANEIMKDAKIKVLSKVEITSEEQLTDIRKYVKPLEARRMGKS